MDLREFSKANLERCTSEGGFNHSLESWSPAEWTNAMAGEMGEAANITKKILRHDQGIPGNVKPDDADREMLRRRAIDEIADVIIYADLAIQALGGDTSNAVREKFNRKSAQIGCDITV